MSKLKILTLVTLISVLAAVCAPATATPTPIMTEIPVTGGEEDEGEPGSVAVVESIEILILESFPLQVNAVIRGTLPDAGCTTVASVEQVREGNTFTLTLVTTTDPLALCAQALTPFEEVVPLDVQDLPAGEYLVVANGFEQAFEFPGNLSPEEPAEQPIDTDVYPTDVQYVMAQQDAQIHFGVGGSPTIVGELFTGQIAQVTGINWDGNWWQIVCPEDPAGSCWVSADPSLTQPTEGPG